MKRRTIGTTKGLRGVIWQHHRTPPLPREALLILRANSGTNIHPILRIDRRRPSTPHPMTTIAALTAADVMRRSLVFARPDQKLDEAERLLVDHRITGMPVIEGTRLVGVVSGSDLARARVLAEALDGQIRDEMHWDETQADGFAHDEPERIASLSQRYQSLRVRDVMRSQVVTCDRGTPISQVAALLISNRIHRILVVDADRPVGIISSLDLVKLLCDS